jgi:hypothetical protein
LPDPEKRLVLVLPDDDVKLLRRLLQQGHCCSSVLLQLGLNLIGEKNPQLVHAVSGLCNGLQSGLFCGALSGGCCMLTLFSDGQGDTEEMSRELVNWFDATYGSKYGGMDCLTMTQNDPQRKREFCPSLVEAAYNQAKSILLEYGKIAG